MLQVRNLTKIYTVKGGVQTRALNGVTLSFPEKGMVFLLGKSGSGKSTLLNVCGGLDNPTDGEIIVKGRSSRDFTQGDFDSYRNTFIGFVFQEYNILNEFTVEDNIALALELQGKPKNKEAIANLLSQVDLDGYAKRKPNTLSGGQKQRIAIARALIKNPEIIMADEPTGALDSATGKQVLETLKKLSETKLVIVVSHDREFAEQYGDRIIELQDGSVLSDVSKNLEKQQAVGDSANVTVIGGNTLNIKDGDSLTEEDYAFIRGFLGGKKNAIITNGTQEIANFKRVNRITATGEREVFAQTDEEKIQRKQYTAKDSKFIRSRLPMHRAAKIGVSSLKVKPIRLIFTIILCVVSFTMFGLFSTLMIYDKEATLRASIQNSNISYLVLQKEYQKRQHTLLNGEEYGNVYSYSESAKLTQAEIDAQKDIYGTDVFGGVEVDARINNLAAASDTLPLYQNPRFTYIAALPETNTLRADLIAGSYPQKKEEICISTYMARSIVENDLTVEGQKPTTIEGVIGKKLQMDLNAHDDKGQWLTEYTVTGIFESGLEELKKEYPNLCPDKQENIDFAKQREEQNAFMQRYEESLHGVLLGTQSLLENCSVYSKGNQNPLQNLFDYEHRLTFDTSFNHMASFVPSTRLPKEVKVFGKRTPAVGETVVTYNFLSDAIMDKTHKEREALVQQIRDQTGQALREKLTQLGYFAAGYNEYNMPFPDTDPEMYQVYNDYWCEEYRLNEFVSDYGWLIGKNIPNEGDIAYRLYTEIFLPLWTEGENSYQARYEKLYPLSMKRASIDDINGERSFSEWRQILWEGKLYDQETGEAMMINDATREKIALAFIELLQDKTFTGQVVAHSKTSGEQMAVGKAYPLKIVGVIDADDVGMGLVFVDESSEEEMSKTVRDYRDYDVYTNYEETKYVQSEDAIFDIAFLRYLHTEEQTKGIDSFSGAFGEDDSRIILYNAIAQEVMMVNEMVDELSQVFMWIGIILAVFSALLLSNFISVSIANKKKEIGILRAVGARGTDVFKIFFSESFTIAFICTVISLIASVGVCGVLNAEMGAMLAGVSLFNFGFISMGILLGVAVGTAILATFLPVYFAARKKPVESIRAL